MIQIVNKKGEFRKNNHNITKNNQKIYFSNKKIWG